jgi:hypothetical protein
MNSPGKRFSYRTHTEEISLEGTREPVEEPDQRERNELRARLFLHEEARLTIVCLALLTVILGLLFFFTTPTIFLLYMTLVLTLVLYGVIEVHFGKSQRTRP